MAYTGYRTPPIKLREVLGEDVYRYLLELHRNVYGALSPTGGTSDDGTLNARNVVPVEDLKTDETDTLMVLSPAGSAALQFARPAIYDKAFLVLTADAALTAERVATAGTNITITDAGANSTATWAVSPQGAGSLLDADLLDARQATAFVWSLAKSGETGLTQAVTLSEGANVTLTQVGQNIAIAAVAGAGIGGEAYVTIGNTASLTAERALTGTVDEITLTDGGANGAATLSFAGGHTGTGAVALATRPTIALGDGTTTFQDTTDPTKQLVFELSSIPTGTTRTWTFQSTSDTFVGRATSDILQNKLILDTNCSFCDTDTTRRFTVQCSGISASTTRTWTVPDVDDTFVGTTATQTLSAKTLTAPTIADFTNAQHDHLDADDGGTLSATAIGSGILALARGGTGADLSATGGASQILRQSSAGAVVTVGTLAIGEMSDVDDATRTSGDLLTWNGTNWVDAAPSAISGVGDVDGPGSATDEALARFDGTTGKIIQNSVGTLTDAGILAGLTSVAILSDTAELGLYNTAGTLRSRYFLQESGSQVTFQTVTGFDFLISTTGGGDIDFQSSGDCDFSVTGVLSLTAASLNAAGQTWTDLGTVTIGTFANTGLHILDTNATHDLIIAPGSNITADRTLTLTTGDADRTLTINASTTLGGGTHSGTNTGDQTITLTGDVTGSGTGSFAATIANDAVTNAKLRNSGALSVVGRSANSTGDPADISATAASGQVLRESGSVLGFGTIATAGIADAAVTYAKMQDVSATDRLLGRVSAGSGDVEEVVLDTDDTLAANSDDRVATQNAVKAYVDNQERIALGSYHQSVNPLVRAYFPLVGSDVSGSATSLNVRCGAPITGTFIGWTLWCQTGPVGVGITWTVTITNGTSAATAAFTVSAAGVTTSTNTLSVTAGDLLYADVVASGGVGGADNISLIGVLRAS